MFHYLKVFRDFGTPEEYDRLLDELGSPERAEQYLKAFKARAKRWEWWEEFWIIVKTGVSWLGYGGVVIGFVMAVRAAYYAFFATGPLP